MKQIKKVFKISLLCSAITVCILDSQTTIQGALDGISLCLQTVIPSLFPFMILSIVFCQTIAGQKIPVLHPLGRLLCIPRGLESVFLISILGGYPIGAQNIYAIYKKKMISRTKAQELLCYFNNAGPAFIFGMIGSMFQSKVIPAVLWIVHIMSAILVGLIIPKVSVDTTIDPTTEKTSFTSFMSQAIVALSNICGWVIVFHIIIHFLQRWLLWMLPEEISIPIIGFLDLANGAVTLSKYGTTGFRFIASAGILGFGGLCVTMQTMFVTKELGIGKYIPSKLLHSAIGILLSIFLQSIILAPQERFHISFPFIALICLIICVIVIYLRKNSSIPEKSVV